MPTVGLKYWKITLQLLLCFPLHKWGKVDLHAFSGYHLLIWCVRVYFFVATVTIPPSSQAGCYCGCFQIYQHTRFLIIIWDKAASLHALTHNAKHYSTVLRDGITPFDKCGHQPASAVKVEQSSHGLSKKQCVVLSNHSAHKAGELRREERSR